MSVINVSNNALMLQKWWHWALSADAALTSNTDSPSRTSG
jgi:hypothetical protein